MLCDTINYTNSEIEFNPYEIKGMLKNNIEIDVKVKCVEEQTTQAELAEKVGTSPSYVNRLIKSPEKIVNATYIKMMEQLGYDVQTRKVKWLKHLPRTAFSQGALYEIGSAMSFFTVKNYADEFMAALDKDFKKNYSSDSEDESIGATAEDIIEST